MYVLRRNQIPRRCIAAERPRATIVVAVMAVAVVVGVVVVVVVVVAVVAVVASVFAARTSEAPWPHKPQRSSLNLQPASSPFDTYINPQQKNFSRC